MPLGGKICCWLPRVLGIAFALFLALFALDVFDTFRGWGIAVPLLIHLVPSFVLLGVVAIAWRHELVGAFVFLGFAVFYISSAGLDRPWSWYTAIALPSAVVGALYLVSWIAERRHARRTD